MFKPKDLLQPVEINGGVRDRMIAIKGGICRFRNGLQ
jgi:hypothetical protein